VRALRSFDGRIDGIGQVHETEKAVLMWCEKLRSLVLQCLLTSGQTLDGRTDTDEVV